MGWGAVLYNEIGKKVRDLLYKDYNPDIDLIIGSIEGPDFDVTFNTLNEFDFQMYNNNITTFIQADTESRLHYASLTVDKLPLLPVPGLKTIFGFLPKQNQISGEVQYLNDFAALSSSIHLKRDGSQPVLNLSGVIGSSHGNIGSNVVAVGADVSFDIKSGNFTKCNATLSHSNADRDVTFSLNDKGDCLQGSYYYAFSSKLSVGAEISHSFSTKENTFAFGNRYEFLPFTSLKARVNNLGKLSAVVQRELGPKAHFTISGELDTKAVENRMKIGVAIRFHLGEDTPYTIILDD